MDSVQALEATLKKGSIYSGGEGGVMRRLSVLVYIVEFQTLFLRCRRQRLVTHFIGVRTCGTEQSSDGVMVCL